MPLTRTGSRVAAKMRAKYGARWKRVFYASINKGVAGSSGWHVKGPRYPQGATIRSLHRRIRSRRRRR